LRYADIYGGNGAHGNPHPLNYFIQMLTEGRRPIIRGAGDTLHDHIFVDDAVSANLQALTLGDNQTVHISSGEGYTLKQLYTLCAQALRSDIEPVYISGALAEASAITLDNSLARRALNWQPEVGMREGLMHLLHAYGHFQTPTQPEQRETHLDIMPIQVSSLSRV
jgi:UDP-glucose 4-epimerase